MHDVYMLVALCWPQYQKWLLEWSSHGSSFGLNPRSWSGDAYDHKHILAFLYFSTLLCSVIAKKKKKGRRQSPCRYGGVLPERRQCCLMLGLHHCCRLLKALNAALTAFHRALTRLGLRFWDWDSFTSHSLPNNLRGVEQRDTAAKVQWPPLGTQVKKKRLWHPNSCNFCCAQW